MSSIVNTALIGNTITYNGVQFGGSDSNHKSVPPTYRFRGRFVYDDAGMAVKHTEYVLSVSSTFYHNTSEGSLAETVENVRLKLAQPGKTLKIEGLGTGFGTIVHDEEWGPKPLDFSWEPFGIYAWMCTWNVLFCIKECETENHNPNALSAFNFDTIWQNDFEGVCERTISGYAEIPVYRRNGTNIAAKVADEVRNQLNIVCPPGFFRLRNVWREDMSKHRINFVITDRMESGTALPIGCTQAEADVSFRSQGPGFANSEVTLSMSLLTSPDLPPSAAGTIFLTSASMKQQSLRAGIAKGAVIPKSIQISNRKFRGARQTNASMSWMVTSCLADAMKASGIWEPVVQTDYNQWRASVQELWNNRGFKGVIGSQTDEVVVVDLCQNVSDVLVGSTAIGPNNPNGNLNFQFKCDDVPLDGGWLYHDLVVSVYRENEQTWHRKATTYNPEAGYDPGISASASDDAMQIGSYPFSQESEATQSDIEYNGLPTTKVLLQFRAYRVKHKPTMPVITTVAGLPVVEKKVRTRGPRVAFDAVSCPVWAIQGWRLYEVNGYVPSIKASKSKSSCSAPDKDEKDY